MANLKRQPATILTEENLKSLLNGETQKLNLENHYWISNSFISKLSHMAPNLLELSLRRMPQVTNLNFAEAFQLFKSLVRIDFCDCKGMHFTAL